MIHVWSENTVAMKPRSKWQISPKQFCWPFKSGLLTSLHLVFYLSPVQAHCFHQQRATGPVCVWPQCDIWRVLCPIQQFPTWFWDTSSWHISYEVRPQKTCSQTCPTWASYHHYTTTCPNHQICAHRETQTSQAPKRPWTGQHKSRREGGRRKAKRKEAWWVMSCKRYASVSVCRRWMLNVYVYVCSLCFSRSKSSVCQSL